eukprot:TRINITY_DN43668_c0_g1_i1.p1 TRINITY_DN43668_c0_g1~~TRINITY_DN43668_c0_g1_i1.p1  ORF type:complete len:429 (-),score=63.48 TRINITY_DN43668_c0_g1_i1:20-1306(-)
MGGSQGKTAHLGSGLTAPHKAWRMRGEQARTPEEALPIAKREEQLVLLFMQDHADKKMWLADSHDGSRLAELLRPEDGELPKGAAPPPPPKLPDLPLPRDAEGYAVAFDVTDTANIKEFFDKYGLVVVRRVADEEACERSREELWDLVEREVPKVNRHEPETWNAWPSLAQLGLLGMTMPLTPQLCRNRINDSVYASFAAVFGRRDLHVNIGRLGAMRPTKSDSGSTGVQANGVMGSASLGEDKPHWRTAPGAEWLHWDANPWTGAVSSFSWNMPDPVLNRGYDRLAVQAVLALGDCKESNGGFFCVPGSHKIFRDWGRAHNHPSIRAQMLSPEGPSQFRLPSDDPLKLAAEVVPIREGDLLIWNAYLAHSNSPNQSSSMRLVQYIQMKPADDRVMLPLLDDASLLPPASEFDVTPLGRKLLGMGSWQ